MAKTSIAVKILGDAKGFTGALDEAGGKLGRFTRGIGKVGGAAALAGGAAIGGAVVKGLTTALDRGGTLNTLANNLGLSADQAAKAGDAAARAFGDGFGSTFEEAAAISSTLAGLGVQTTDALADQTKQISALVETFGADQGELLASTSALINRGFVADTAEAFDLFAESARGSFIPLSEQLDLMNEYGDQIAQVGLTGEEAFGLISQASSSFEADKILDTFKELAIRGQDMSDTSVAALEQLGLNAEEVARAFGTGGESAAKARDDILEALASIEDPVARNAAGVALMGTAFEDLGLDPLDKLNAVGAALDVNATSAETLAEKSLTVSDRFGALGRKAETALAQIGEALLPVIENAMPSLEAGLQRAVDFFQTHLPTAIEFARDVFDGLRPVIEAIVDALAAVADWVTANWPPMRDVILDVFNEISAWVEANWPAIRDTIVDVMTTIGEIIAEVLELVGAIWTRWGDEILLVTETIFKAIGPVIQAALDIVLAIIRTVTALIRGDWDEVWEGLKDITEGAIDLIVGFVEGGMDLWRTYTELAAKAVKQLFSGAWEAVVRIVRDGIDSVITWVRGIAGRATTAASGVPGALKAAGAALIQNFYNEARRIFDNVLLWLGSLPRRVTSAVGNLGSILKNAGRAILQGLWNGLQEKWRQVSGWLSGIKNKIPRLKGPIDVDRRILTDNGEAIMEGLQTGLARGWTNVERQLAGYTVDIGGSIQPSTMNARTPVRDGRRDITIQIGNITVNDGRDLFDELDRRARLVVA